MLVVAVVDSYDAVCGDVERLADAVAFEVGDGDDFPAFLQNSRNGEAAVVPAHFLVERGAAVLPGFQVDDVVKRQHQGNGAAQRGCIGRAVQQVGAQALYCPRQGYLLPKRVGGACQLYNGEVGGGFQAAVFAGGYDNVVFVAVVPLL